MRRKMLVVLLIFGTLQFGYGAWGGLSDRASAPLIVRDGSCQASAFDQQGVRIGACRVESAVVVEKNWHSQKQGGPIYWVVSVNESGKRDDTPLATSDAAKFWNRLAPTERFQQMRFVHPGYHRTGDILAFSDHHGFIFSRYDPRSGTHYNFMYVFMGGMLALVCGWILVSGKARTREGVSASWS